MGRELSEKSNELSSVGVIAAMIMLAGLLFSSASPAKLPPDALKILESFPGKAISLDLVLQKAMEGSDSFRNVLSAVPAIEAPKLRADSAFEPNFYIKISHLDDRNKAASPFQPQSLLQTSYTLGTEKLFSTGTLLSAEIAHSYNELGIAAIAPYYQTIGKITISQNLWNNAFGYGTRRLQEAAELSVQANRIGFEEDVETWTIALVQLFYNAWLSKAQAELGDQSLARRKKLLRTTEIKSRRGTAEEQDLLQIQSAALNAEVQKEQSDESLNSVWRELVIALKLPGHWIHLDPKDIPMALDNPVATGLQACRQGTQPKSDTTLEQAELLAEAAQLDLERTQNAMAPNLDLQFQFYGNGLNNQRGHSFDEAVRVDNPAFLVALQLKVPLHRFSEEADYRQAVTTQMRAEANRAYQKGQLELKWLNACKDLLRQEEAYRKIKSAYQKQKRRANLEQRLFSIGRSPTINVIQAEDDADAAQSRMNQTEAQMRLAAWKVRQVQGQIPKYLSGLGFDPGKMTLEQLKRSYETAD